AFEQYGKNVGEGVEGGIVSKIGDVSRAAAGIAKAASSSFKGAAKIQSPSRVFISHGENISEGTAIGIENGESNILAKIQSVFNGMMGRTQTGFKGVADDSEEGVNKVGAKMLLLSIVSKTAMDSMMRKVRAERNYIIKLKKTLSICLYVKLSTMQGKIGRIGEQAMSGLNSGLWGGTASVMATARNIANSVSSTMRSGLRIHSPSHV